MDRDMIFPLILLGHILGDFYFQTDNVADRKKRSNTWLILHCVIYSSCMLAVLLIGARYDHKTIWLWLFASFFHMAVDFFKKYYLTKIPIIGKKPFISDQILHMALLGITWFALGRELHAADYILYTAKFLPEVPVLLIILGIFLIERPIGFLIQSNEIFDFRKIPKSSVDGAGKTIGYLERLITFALLIFGQFGVIGFVISAKSIMRFPEISQSNEKGGLPVKVEYYLIGTLISMTSVFVITILLGLF